MEIGLDEEHKIYILKLNDRGALMKTLDTHKIKFMFNFTDGEYVFHNATDYHAALLLV